MKKLATLFLCVALLFTSCASTFGAPGNQSNRQRKNDKIVGTTIVVVGAVVIGMVVVNNYDK